MNIKRLRADIELVASAEGISCGDGHSLPFLRCAALYDNRKRKQRGATIMEMAMNIALISTYELGRQPFGLVSPAAWLRKRGHAVVCLDLTRQALEDSAIRAADLLAIYLPMHTATRLAVKLIPALREKNPRAHICCYGLYAPVHSRYPRSLGAARLRRCAF